MYENVKKVFLSVEGENGSVKIIPNPLLTEKIMREVEAYVKLSPYAEFGELDALIQRIVIDHIKQLPEFPREYEPYRPHPQGVPYDLNDNLFARYGTRDGVKIRYR